MIAPNKVLSFSESALSHLGSIIRQGPRAIDILTLYRNVCDEFESIDQFLLALDTLFVLGRIDLNAATRTLTYVA